jgi:hypothetical protein
MLVTQMSDSLHNQGYRTLGRIEVKACVFQVSGGLPSSLGLVSMALTPLPGAI